MLAAAAAAVVFAFAVALECFFLSMPKQSFSLLSLGCFVLQGFAVSDGMGQLPNIQMLGDVVNQQYHGRTCFSRVAVFFWYATHTDTHTQLGRSLPHMHFTHNGLRASRHQAH